MGRLILTGRSPAEITIPFFMETGMNRLPLAGLALLALVTACGDDNGPNNHQASSVAYAGTFASDAHSGTVVFNTAPAAVQASAEAGVRAPIQLVGTLTFSDQSTVDLTGVLDGTDLLLEGGGYTFGGTLSSGVISGAFSGPGGETGSFSVSITTDNAQVALYCGTYDGDDSGVFSLALKPDRTGGVIVVPSSGAGGQTGRSRAKTGTSDQIEVLPDAAPGFVIATGTLLGIAGTSFDSVTGLWDDGDGSSGTFGGSTRCQ